jgi:hypothetical protein
MQGLRYRSYVVRTWTSDEGAPADARARIEWIGPGIQVETRGSAASDLAAWLERAFASVDSAPRPRDAALDGPGEDEQRARAVGFRIGDPTAVNEGGRD